MWRISILLVTIYLVGMDFSSAQFKKRYTVEASENFDKLCFVLSASSGTCQIRPTHHPKLVTIYCKSEDENYNPVYESRLEERQQFVKMDLKDNQSVSSKVFGGSYSDLENKCNIYLSHDKPFILDLSYGVGNAFADLSGLPIEKLKINTGSADVKVGYQNEKPNTIEMDTFAVKVDMGSLDVKRLNLSKAKNVIADVGFGNLTLNFSGESLIKTDVTASVGAGTLEIILEDQEVPVIVHVNNSLLCRVKLNRHFKEIRKNVFVNKGYSEDAPNLLTFNVDVAMGNIRFK
ncbi:hypothetical protein QQ008_04175 [Fulvivirgaceae bacterium BMA10]|uniref:Adhesin domain-containing protein n=1 Tax=Splendidivirga corallicola TaxID=3051826 RepID=A0ABT8KLC8_9BACT|nr:hypothetical protein [Fulvivirgaceae bacterium BMA10]